MRFSDFPFLRYLLFFLVGIFLGHSIPVSVRDHFIIGLILIWALYFFFLISKKSLLILSLMAYAQIVLFGLVISVPSQSNGFFESKISGPYLAEIQSYDQPKPNSKENLLRIFYYLDSGEWKRTDQQVLIYHQSSLKLEPGQMVVVDGTPEDITGPRNPAEFDYQRFLLKKKIGARQFIPDGKVQIVPAAQTWRLHFLPDQIRETLNGILQKTIPQPSSLPIAQALLLGQKDQLDRSLRKAYSEAGVMHILAVSGLHVGILVAVLLFLIKPLRFSDQARKRYLLFVVLVIWIYATITGLSPSVIRASVMFTLIVLGQMRDRKPPIFNILAFSALLMIVFNPDVIYEVGFQLSYLAVSGIVLIQPLILRLWYPPNRILEYTWQLAAVSIAAQLATFPLSVWYFHTFPVWFLPANLLIIPLTFLIMQVGIPLLFLGWIPFLGNILGWAVGFLIQVELGILNLFRTLPFRLQDVSIQPETMWMIWGFLLLWAAWDYVPKKRMIYLGFVLISFWSFIGFFRYQTNRTAKAVIYRSENSWAIDYWTGQELKSWNQGIDTQSSEYLMLPNRVKSNWGNRPIPLLAMKNTEDRITFPELGIEIQEDKLQIIDSKPKSMYIWDGQRWELFSKSDLIHLPETAISLTF